MSAHCQGFFTFDRWFIDTDYRKSNTKRILGPEGVGEILQAIDGLPSVQTVAIGGINEKNTEELLVKSAATSGKQKLNGIAVVSALMGASNPRAAAERLRELLSAGELRRNRTLAVRDIVSSVPSIVKAVHEKTPLSHNMTNLVCLPISASYSSLGFGIC